MSDQTPEHVVTSCLEFADRYEGQIYYVGDKDSCKDVAGLFSAVSYSGDEDVLNCHMLIIPRDEINADLCAGARWRHAK